MVANALIKAAAIYVALHTLLLMLLAMRVVKERMRANVGVGDGGDPLLLRAIRVHGNAVEQAVPTIAILIMLALMGAPAWAVHVFGVVTLLARVLHASGLSAAEGRSLGRQFGMLLTWTALGVGAIGLIVLAVR
jgi:uncharacterized membrane protein YecN with MAPEG domain